MPRSAPDRPGRRRCSACCPSNRGSSIKALGRFADLSLQFRRRRQRIAEHRNLLVTGPCGIGKSWLACALAQKACRDGYTVHYARVPRLFAAAILDRVVHNAYRLALEGPSIRKIRAEEEAAASAEAATATPAKTVKGGRK
jgi:IstB-like ATP binding protein